MPLTLCCNIVIYDIGGGWGVGRIFGGGWGVGGLEKGGNAPWAMDSQRCKSSASYLVVVMLLCCYVVGCTSLIYLSTWYSALKPHVGAPFTVLGVALTKSSKIICFFS